MRTIYLRLLLVAALVLAVDQATKTWALNSLDQPQTLIDGLLFFRLTYNSGGAFGLLQGYPEVFLFATIAATIAILFWVRGLKERSWAIPLGLVMGGGFGNVADRVFRDTGGRVVDFIELRWWPVFNVADMCIVTGVGVILLLGFKSERAEAGESEADETESGQTESGQTESDQSESDQSESDQTESDQTESDQTESDQTQHQRRDGAGLDA